jgi:hypothetical protein
MKLANFAAVIVIFMSLYANSQQPETGTVCVASRVDDPFWKEEPRLSNGQVNTHGLRLRIDKQPPVEWPVSKGLEISGLDINERHLFVVLSKAGKPIESLRFSFSGYRSSHLCLSYDGYQGIGLNDLSRGTPWCKCSHR